MTTMLRILEILFPRSLAIKRWKATAYLDRARMEPRRDARQVQSNKAIARLKMLTAERHAPVWRQRQCLFRLAEASLLSGDSESAGRYAQSVVASYTSERPAEVSDPFSPKELLEGWDYLRDAHLMLGRIGLDRGNIDRAGHHLVEAARVPSTPVLESFGPDVTLADALLSGGHRALVLSYLSELVRHWHPGKDKVEAWIAAIEGSRTPSGPDWRPRHWVGNGDVQ